MSYSLDPEANFTRQFGVAAGGQLTLAIDALSKRQNGLPEAIHDARKNFKRLRSLYRLAAVDAKAFRRKENVRIRDMSKTLSGARDATALVEVTEYLMTFATAGDEHAALKRLGAVLASRRDDLSEDQKPLEDRVAAAIATCGHALEAVSRMSFDNGKTKTAKRLAKGWRKTLQRAADACAACSDNSDAHLFHELRKRCQDYRSHLTLLQPLWPSAMRAKRAETEQLVELLGHHNDLAVLSSLLTDQPDLMGKSGDAVHILSAVDGRQEKLRENVLKTAKSVLRDDPKDESRTIRLLWMKGCA